MPSTTEDEQIEAKAVDDGVQLRIRLNGGLAFFQCELEIDEAEILAEILKKEAGKARRKMKANA